MDDLDTSLSCEGWPTCPDCGRRRITACPVCKTASTDFDLADPEFLGSPGRPDPSHDPREAACGCGLGMCSGGKGASAEPEDGPDAGFGPDADPEDAGHDNAPPALLPAAGLVLICSTCDEPFRAEFPRRCEWCGHQFADGFEVDVSASGEPPEELNARTLGVLVAMILVAIGAVLYFVLVLPSG